MNTFTLSIRNVITVFLLSLNLLNGQENNIYRDLGVKEVRDYIFNPIQLKDAKDSLLIRVIHLDSLGEVKSRKILYQTGEVAEYMHYYRDGRLSKITKKLNGGKNEKIQTVYKYNRAGKLRLKKNYSRGSLRGKEFFKFDSKGRIRERLVKNFSYTKKRKYVYLYNEKGQKIKQYSKNTDKDDLEFEYDEHGNEIITYRIDNKEGKVVHIVKEYDEKNRLIKEKRNCITQFFLPEIEAKIYTEKGDVWVRKYEYGENGLIIEARQWLNNILVGIKKIEYKM